MDRLLDFTDKTILITGAGSGFGKLLAKQFGERGANLVLADINAEALMNVVDELNAEEGKVITQTANIAKEDDHRALVDSAIATFGGIDIAINNAGISQQSSILHKMEEASFDAQIDVNLKGVFFGMKHQLKAMIKSGGGSILNVSSIAGTEAAPTVAGYAAAKHGVIGLTKTAAVEYGSKGVRVNAVCPFLAATPLLEQGEGMDQSVRDAIAMRSPMRRIGEPQEIVNTMVLLCSPANSYMNGQAILIDGGVSAY
jgi:NAD(P)-dependent dehydrogenase (short-subunit alcohol dehydrogenase family)